MMRSYQDTWTATSGRVVQAMLDVNEEACIVCHINNYHITDDFRKSPLVGDWDNNIAFVALQQPLLLALAASRAIMCKAADDGSPIATGFLCSGREVTVILVVDLVMLLAALALLLSRVIYGKWVSVMRHDHDEHQAQNLDATPLECRTAVLGNMSRKRQTAAVSKWLGRIVRVAKVVVRFILGIGILAFAGMTYTFEGKVQGAIELSAGMAYALIVLGLFTWSDYHGCPRG